MTAGRRAAIAGAGIGGLSAALALRRSGWTVHVFEREPVLAEVGAGLQLAPNALRPLFALGLEEALRRAGSAPEVAEIRRGRDGALLHLTPYADAERRWGAPYLQIRRADLQAILLEAVRAAGAELALGAEVSGATTDGRITLASGRELQADLVVGADGWRSRVAALVAPVPRAASRARVAWRALIPRDRLPAGLADPVTTVRIGAGRHLVTYPLRGGAWLNLVAISSGRAPSGWAATGDPADLRRLFAGWAEPVPSLMRALGRDPVWCGAVHDVAPLSRWTAGRTALVGDAAHPISPSFAQGAAMAIEDAWALTQAVEDGVDDETLSRYATARLARVRRVRAGSRLNGWAFHLPATLSTPLFRLVARLDRADPLRRFDGVYSGG